MAHPDKRNKILAAAVKIFATYGFYNSRVSSIAREAGVADGTIYLYFKSKEEILLSVFRDTMELAIERQRKALHSVVGPAERLRTFIRVHFEIVFESPALAEVLTVELRQSAKFMRDTDMKPFGRYLALIAQIVAAGQQDGTFCNALQPRRVARAIFGTLDELALEWSMNERRAPLDEVSGQTADIFLRGLIKRPQN